MKWGQIMILKKKRQETDNSTSIAMAMISLHSHGRQWCVEKWHQFPKYTFPIGLSFISLQIVMIDITSLTLQLYMYKHCAHEP